MGKQESRYNLDIYLRPCILKRKMTGRSRKSQAQEQGQFVVSSPATQLSVLATDGGFQFLYPDQNIRLDTLTLQKTDTMKRLVSLFLLAPLAISTLTLSANGQKAYKIALSNSFYGNTWRKQMVDVMQKAANEAKAQGLISDFIVDNGDGTANTQLAQLNSLILSHPDAILINAASPTALNGAIAQADSTGSRSSFSTPLRLAPMHTKLPMTTQAGARSQPTTL